MELLITILSSSIPFQEFRRGFAVVLEGLFVIIFMVSLVLTVFHAVKGEKDGVQRMIKWIVLSVVGLILMVVISRFTV